jgi:hypothetical protein
VFDNDFDGAAVDFESLAALSAGLVLFEGFQYEPQLAGFQKEPELPELDDVDVLGFDASGVVNCFSVGVEEAVLELFKLPFNNESDFADGVE